MLTGVNDVVTSSKELKFKLFWHETLISGQCISLEPIGLAPHNDTRLDSRVLARQ